MQTKVLITIDTEVRTPADRHDAFDHDVLGRSQSNSRGAYWIADQLKSYGFAGVFFLDVYGSGRFRGAPYRELCDRLLDGGHDIQLHTHPDQMYDRKRECMHEYSLAEQTTIVRDGMALLKDWTGKFPTAHRAGSYGANEDTLKALRTNGIFLDSSFFYDHGNCQLPFAYSNAPFTADGVWEVPVTVLRVPVRRLGISLPFLRRSKIPYIVTFLHSFSFTRRQADGFVPDEDALASFQAMLRLLAENNIPGMTFDQLAAKYGETHEGVQPSVSSRESS